MSTEPTEADLQLRVACGLLASATRFVPIPILDDFLREKAFQLMVSRTLRSRGRTIGSASIGPLYADPTGCVYGCLVGMLIFPFKLLFGWALSLLLAARNLARDLSEAVLLGHVLDRRMAAGDFENDTDKATLKARAKRARIAFDSAVKGTDMVLLQRVLRGAITSIDGLLSAGLRSLGGLRKKAQDADPTERMTEIDKAKVKENTRRISAALDTPEMHAFLEAFDARFDETLRDLEAGELPTSDATA